MRSITSKAIAAFNANHPFKSANTSVRHFEYDDITIMYLHGNEIARKKGNEVQVSNAGWQSNTTKERLNGITGVSIYQKKGVWYLNGEIWNGNWKTI